ncbi:glutamate 5-kinase [Magnetococcus marinus MC-1]|uniref:Glutamate 5-kinase n=1 Tax=Magnetococcus marinus (strain ATCC BAA-1437 / JCM 17883 / MC-1) TaxID=156889 RepID=A0LCZ2_MAGMM|nr:glutamate 5-kinase [Magnetococcus marinus]ABK45835.1 glutamate 5-kinase [Magnetococcus marinus MC-1]
MREATEAWQRVAAAQRIVVKIGSNLLTTKDGVCEDWIAARCAEIAALMGRGKQVVVVTSGSVAAGASRLGLGRRPATLPEKQAAAAAGQGKLMQIYEQAFNTHGLHTGQILLTRDDVANRRRYLNARDTLETLLTLGLVPVVNENDTVVVEEIRFGDNDTLAALVAGLVEAELLVLLSDVDGLYSADPRKDERAQRIELVVEVTPEIEALAGGTGSEVGSGGMVTKLRAAKMAARTGCMTVLANGFQADPIGAVMGGGVGTLFLSLGDAISSRKRWIANGLTCEGSLFLDEGAVAALLKGKSLLARGVVAVEGVFDRGAALYCCDVQGRRIAKGLVNYRSDHMEQIKGKHSWEIEAALGFIIDEEVMHRDDMVQLVK